MMANLRYSLMILHVLITIFLIYNLHPELSHVAKSSTHEKQISTILAYINNLFRISFYHSSCLIAIWYSRRRAAGMIHATAILLIGEFFEVLTTAIQHMLETKRLPAVELVFDVIYVWLFLAAIIITFRLARKISDYHKDLMRLELLNVTASDLAMEGGGEFSLV